MNKQTEHIVKYWDETIIMMDDYKFLEWMNEWTSPRHHSLSCVDNSSLEHDFTHTDTKVLGSKSLQVHVSTSVLQDVSISFLSRCRVSPLLRPWIRKPTSVWRCLHQEVKTGSLAGDVTTYEGENPRNMLVSSSKQASSITFRHFEPFPH